MQILISWLVSALIIIVAAYLLPGVHVENFLTALVLALVLGILNAFLKPLLIVLTLPINVLTLGLFTLVINALLILLAGLIVPGFSVDTFWWAVLYSLLISLFNIFLARV